MLFPYIDYNNYNVKKMRLVSIENKDHEKYVISSGNEGLFGWNKCIYYLYIYIFINSNKIFQFFNNYKY